MYDVNGQYNQNNNDYDHADNKDARENDTVPVTVRYTTRISSNEEPSALQCSNNQNIDPINDFDTHFDATIDNEFDTTTEEEYGITTTSDTVIEPTEEEVRATTIIESHTITTCATV